MAVKNTITGEILDKAPAQYRAHFTGVCAKCNNAVNINDYIVWSKAGVKRTYHVNCANPQVWPFQEIAEQTPAPFPAKRAQSAPTYDMSADMTEICENCGQKRGAHNYGYCTADEFNPQFFKPITPVPAMPEPAFEGDEAYKMELPQDEPAFDDTMHRKPASGGNGSDALLDLISERVESKVIDTVKRKVDSAISIIDRSVKDKLDKLSIPTITLKRPELPEIKIHNVHKQFKDVLQLLNAGEYVYLHGSPGGHKSSIGPQLAEALGVRYGYMSLCEQTPEYVVKGFTSPIDGKYYGSMFTDFYENGGLFCWEEMDAANDNLRSSLNTMLENKQAALDKGLVSMHPKFYMLANGNTCGRGAHPAFPARTSFDAAFAARFIFLQFEYDWDLCKHIATSLNKQAAPIVEWGEKVCNWALANGVQLVMSPREIYKLAKLMVMTDLSDSVLLDGVLRGLDVPSKEKMLSSYPFPSISRK